MGHSRNLSTFTFTLLKRLFYPQKRIYLWTHGFYGKESRIERIWKKLLLGLADDLFIYGDYACNIMKEKYGFKEEKLHPIHNSLEYDIQAKLRNEIKPSSVYANHFQNNNPTIIFIGRLTTVKKLHMLVQAIADLKAKSEEYNLVFVGDGPVRHDLEQQASQLGVSNQIWFYGACYDEKENAELVYNADLCVAPGNIGLTSIHALMFGCPAISHNDFAYQMPEFEAIKEGITGSFFLRGNQQSLNDTICNWFTQTGYDREVIRKACYDEIDNNWNPNYQMNIIKGVIK
jgi:glycosyltransferase involved in cell wall biosynthesis